MSKFPKSMLAYVVTITEMDEEENGDNVSSKSITKMNSSVFSSGFSGYIRVRPPEPKKEGCKDEGSHSHPAGISEKEMVDFLHSLGYHIRNREDL